MRTARTWLPLIVALIVALAGCNKPPEAGGKNPEKVYGTIISLSPGTTELIGNYLMEGTVLRGRTAACNYPPHVTSVPVVCSVKPDYEKIAEIKPDLIVYDKTLFTDADIEKLKQVAPRADHLVFEGDTVDSYMDFVYRLGSALQSATRFSEYVDKVHAKAMPGRTNPPDPRPKAMVLIGGGGTEYMAAGLDGFLADAIRSAGGTPIGPKSRKFETINVEALIQDNPNVIFTNSPAQVILADKRLQNVDAVKHQRIIEVNGDILLRAGTRVDRLLERFYSAIGNASHDMAQKGHRGEP